MALTLGARVLVVVLLLGLGAGAMALVGPSATPVAPLSKGPAVHSLYDFQTTTLDGKPADLGSYRGKVTLVVNVASKCGFTPQYEGLEALHREMAGREFSVLGFPSNDFGGQEPGTAGEIAEFCRLTYGVSFPMFAKVVTKAGPDQSPIYSFLGQSGNLPSWNFGKYVLGKDGKVVAYFSSRVTPQAKELREAITKAMGQGS